MGKGDQCCLGGRRNLKAQRALGTNKATIGVVTIDGEAANPCPLAPPAWLWERKFCGCAASAGGQCQSSACAASVRPIERRTAVNPGGVSTSAGSTPLAPLPSHSRRGALVHSRLEAAAGRDSSVIPGGTWRYGCAAGTRVDGLRRDAQGSLLQQRRRHGRKRGIDAEGHSRRPCRRGVGCAPGRFRRAL